MRTKGNVGDSRTVLFSGGVARALSDDHKPDRPDEQQRVRAAGGVVSQRPRDCYRVWSANPAVRFGKEKESCACTSKANATNVQTGIRTVA